ncbi:MAG: hypothetical protein AAFP28_12720, partial [Pseudomonadota bacterium]
QVDVAALPQIERADLILSPRQGPIAPQEVDLGYGAHAALKHTYDIAGTVVTARPHLAGGMSEIAPIDLGIAWGPMARREVLAAGRFSAGHRFLKWNVPEDMVPMSEQAIHISNTHLIPADNAVRDAMMEMKPGQSVRLTGFLVDVYQDGMLPWRSSVTRDDGFPAGCEIMLVTQAEITRG